MKLSRILLTATGGLAGVALCLATRTSLSPLRAADGDKIQVYILSSCRGSQIAAQEFAVPPLNESIQLIPLDGYDDSLGRSLCRSYLREVTPRNPLLRLVPEKFACNWLAQDARASYGAHGSFPVMVFRDEALTDEREREVFAQFGLAMATTRDTFGITVMGRGG